MGPRLDALRAQLEELEAFESVYPGALVLDAAERHALGLARDAAEGAAAATASPLLDWLPDLSGELR
jgi:hypothetical protein